MKKNEKEKKLNFKNGKIRSRGGRNRRKRINQRTKQRWRRETSVKRRDKKKINHNQQHYLGQWSLYKREQYHDTNAKKQ